MYLEDVDFCAAIRARGRRVMFVPGVEVVHLRGQSVKAAAGGTRAYRRSARLLCETPSRLGAAAPAVSPPPGSRYIGGNFHEHDWSQLDMPRLHPTCAGPCQPVQMWPRQARRRRGHARCADAKPRRIHGENGGGRPGSRCGEVGGLLRPIDAAPPPAAVPPRNRARSCPGDRRARRRSEGSPRMPFAVRRPRPVPAAAPATGRADVRRGCAPKIRRPGQPHGRRHETSTGSGSGVSSGRTPSSPTHVAGPTHVSSPAGS
jgi:hypothetical protein